MELKRIKVIISIAIWAGATWSALAFIDHYAPGFGTAIAAICLFLLVAFFWIKGRP
jgi:hypothetical protein